MTHPHSNNNNTTTAFTSNKRSHCDISLTTENDVDVETTTPNVPMTEPSSPSTDPSQQQQLISSLNEEYQSIVRVSHRVDKIENMEQFQSIVLDKLLIKLFLKFQGNYPALTVVKTTSESDDVHGTTSRTTTSSTTIRNIRQKIHDQLIQLFSLILKRIQQQQQQLPNTPPSSTRKVVCLVIPCLELLQQLFFPSLTNDTKETSTASSSSSSTAITTVPAHNHIPPKSNIHTMDSFTINFAFTFIQLGLQQHIPSPPSRNDYSQLLSFLLVLYTDAIVLSQQNQHPLQQQHQQSSSPTYDIKIAHFIRMTILRGVVMNNVSSNVINAIDDTINSVHQKGMALVRTLLQEQPIVASCFYDLCLDLLLYVPTAMTNTSTATTLPPPGLSQYGWKRLMTTNHQNTNSMPWNNERPILVQNKLAIYTMMTPISSSLQQQYSPFHLFMNSTLMDTNIAGYGNDEYMVQKRNMARMVVLMVVASISHYPEIADRATLDLKLYLERCSTSTSTDVGTTSRSSSRRSNSIHSNLILLGDPMMVAIELISLCLGQIHSDRIILEQQQKMVNHDHKVASLGFSAHEPSVASASTTTTSSLLLQWKRRPLDEITQCPKILTFITNQILNDYIHLFQEQSNSVTIIIFSNMTTQLLYRILCGSNNSTIINGLSTLRAKPYIAAAELLNVLSIRLAVYHDEENDLSTASNANDIVTILCRCLSIACTVLAPITAPSSSSSNNNSGNDGSLTVRDACYGVIATLSHCTNFVLHRRGYLFGGGTASMNATDAVNDGNGEITNIDTASLLFGCTIHEDERLRPRAVAALDALLAAYRRLLTTSTKQENTQTTKIDVMPSMLEKQEEGKIPMNPWATHTSTTDVNENPAVDYSGFSNLLRNLLWSIVRRQQSTTACRIAAARWSCDLWKEIDLLNACHILCFLSGDSDSTVASIARDGIGLPKQLDDDDEGMVTLKSSGFITDNKFPDFSDFTALIFPDRNATNHHLFWDFSYAGKASTLRCALYCLLTDFYGGGTDAAVSRYLVAITVTLQEVVKASNQLVDDASIQRKFSVDLLDECSACLLTTLSSSHFARRQMIRAKQMSYLGFDFLDFPHLCLSSNSSRSRRYLAGAYGQLLADSNLWSESLTKWIEETKLHSSLIICENNLREIEKRNPTRSRLHGSAFLGAYIVRALQSRKVENVEASDIAACWISSETLLESLGRGLLHDEDIVSNACSDSLSIALSYDGIDVPPLNERLRNCTISILSNLAKALNKYGHSDTVNPARTMKLAKACGLSLATAAIDGTNSESSFSLESAHYECITALFDLLGSMASRKTEELSIVVGEALADFADAHRVNRNAPKSPNTRDWPVDFDESYAKGLPPQEQVLYILLRNVLLATSPHKRVACAPALLAVTARGAYRLHTDNTGCKRPIVESLIFHLNEVQQAFLTLMIDPKGKQFSRESSCIGLAACRGLVKYEGDHGSESSMELSVTDLNSRLLRAFGQTTNFGGSAMMETEAQAAARRDAEGRGQPVEDVLEVAQSEVGGASGIGEAALGAYREMASASVALGRHDIMYGLLFLSLSHPYWTSSDAKYRYSASCLLGENLSVGTDTNSNEFRTALRPYLGKLLPRILRGCYDPNKQTKEQMASLWRGLTGGGADGREAISQHLVTTVDALLSECSSKLWRARVGACGALSEVIVGREWADFGGGSAVLSDDDLLEGGAVSSGVRLLQIWNAASRALDDVQGAVRDSGETLARAVRALTIRLCSSTIAQHKGVKTHIHKENVNKEIDAAAAAGTAIWWLMKKGLNHTCPEVNGASMSTLVEIIGVVRPGILEPSLPTLLTSLLLAVSALEPSALNYMQLRTNDQEGLERARLQLAQTGSLAVAITKCLEVVPRSKLDTQQSIASALDAALRQSAGFATRAATADAVSTLCTTCPTVFRFTGSSVSNPSVRLLRAFYFASERERGTAAKDKMIHALGNLAAICPAGSVRSLAVRACDRYRYSTGNNFDSSSRRAAAAALRTIAVRASNVFSDGGRGDVWCRRVLPVAFIGRKDADAKIASMWQEVWDEGGSVANTSDSPFPMRNYGTRLEEKLLHPLVQECISALQDVSWSSRVAGASALQELCSVGILAPVENIAQPYSVGVDVSSLRVRNRAIASQQAISQCIEVLVKPRLWEGKSELLKTITLLSSKWVASMVSNNGEIYDENKIDEFAQLLPWWPIVISHGKYEGDLCVNDGWFLRGSISADSDKAELDDIAKDTAPVDDRTSINFQHCDEILGMDELEEFVSEPKQENILVTLKGLGRFLIEQAIPSASTQRSTIDKDMSLVFRTTAFSCFKDLMNNVPTSYLATRSGFYRMLSVSLLSMIDPLAIDKDIEKRSPPILIAGAINCIESLLWEGIGISNTTDCDVSKLIGIMKELGGTMQPAWTVRAAAAQCIGQSIRLCDDETIQQYKVVTSVVDAARQALTDRRFWKVRAAGLTILSNLIDRAGHHGGSSLKSTTVENNHQETMKNLESLLPHKEVILKLVRSSLNDSDSNVTVQATSIRKRMSWWP